jgi:hypothetical protein
MSVEPWVKCRVCNSPEFYIVWKANGIDTPEFCPFCGEEEIRYPEWPNGDEDERDN